jgi:hypothetical protein
MKNQIKIFIGLLSLSHLKMKGMLTVLVILSWEQAGLFDTGPPFFFLFYFLIICCCLLLIKKGGHDDSSMIENGCIGSGT